MRKRGATIRHRAKAPPGLVVQTVAQDFELRLRTSVDAFRLGYAQASHFNDLADTVDLLTIAEATGFARKDDGALAAAQLAGVALMNIKDRYNERKRFGVSGDEIHALELLAYVSLDYWSRRSGALYAYAFDRLKQIRKTQYQETEQTS